MSVVKPPSHAWSSGGLVTSSVSHCYSYLYTITSSVSGGRWGSHQCFEDTDLPDGDLLITLHLKGIWGSTSVGKNLFPWSNLFYWVLYPHHHPLHPTMMERGRHPFASCCPLFLQSYVSPCYGRSVSHALFASTQFTGFLEFTIGAKD